MRKIGRRGEPGRAMGARRVTGASEGAAWVDGGVSAAWSVCVDHACVICACGPRRVRGERAWRHGRRTSGGGNGHAVRPVSVRRIREELEFHKSWFRQARWLVVSLPSLLALVGGAIESPVRLDGGRIAFYRELLHLPRLRRPTCRKSMWRPGHCAKDQVRHRTATS